MRERQRTTRWLPIIAAALGLHLLLLLCVKPSVFRFFARNPVAPPRPLSAAASMPDAIISVPVQFEDDDREKPPDVPGAGTPILADSNATGGSPADPSRPNGASRDMLDLLRAASRTLPQGPDPDLVQVLPRPIQITWPDARPPQHCLGYEITVLVQVDEEGRIRSVEPEGANYPADCARAALETARLVTFAPGTVNGRPVKMWTRIRIDFRQRSGH